MSAYRIVVGADTSALNRLASLEYQVLYPSYLKATIPIGANGVQSLAYDVQAAPTFSLPAGGTPTAFEFLVNASKLQLTMTADDGSHYTWPATLAATCSLVLTKPDQVRVQVVKAHLEFTSTPPDTYLQELINRAVLPALVKELDEQWLSSGVLPLDLPGLELGLPVLAIDGGVALAFVSKLGEPAPVPPPPGTPWPPGRVFVLADRPLIDELVELALAQISLTHQYVFEALGLDFVASYFLGVRHPQLGFATQAPFPAQVFAGGVGLLTIRAKNVVIDTVRFEVSATPVFDASVVVDEGGTLARVVFDDVRQQNVAIDLPGLPSFLEKDLAELRRLLNGPLARLILDLLLLAQNALVIVLPQLQLQLGDVTLTVVLSDVVDVGVVDAGGTQRMGFGGLFSLTPGTTIARAPTAERAPEQPATQSPPQPSPKGTSMTHEEILSIKRSAQADLLKLPGVHAVAVGVKFVAGNIVPGELVIQVFVKQKRPLQFVPVDERIPATIQGVGTDVIEEAQLEPHTAIEHRLESSPDQASYRPLQGGCQVRVVTKVNPGGSYSWADGTLGTLVRRASDQAVMALTNQHVVEGSINDKVYQPTQGAISICCNNYCCGATPIGKTAKQVLSTDVDGAIVSIGDTSFKNEIIDLGTVQGSYTVTAGDLANGGYPVKKRGRTTQLTSGKVTSLDLSGTRTDGWVYSGQLGITPDSGLFSDSGDSGSAIVDSQLRVVGLLWGGSSTSSAGSPVAVVEAELEVTVMTGEVSRERTGPSPEEIFRGYLERIEGSDARGLLRVARQHFEEVLRLIWTKRPVTVAWHRQNGPRILEVLTEAAMDEHRTLPTEVDGRPIREAMEVLEVVLKKHGSPALREALEAHRTGVYGLIGLSVGQVLDGRHRVEPR